MRVASGLSRLNRTDWLVPIDSSQPHKHFPSFNWRFESLVKENRRKNRPIGIRAHPIDKYANLI
ncbi:hypothetical protein LINPERPRIM_LOCUS24459 [Linum perenne]